MSAYVVDRNHIDYIVYVAKAWEVLNIFDAANDKWVQLSESEAWEMLYHENVLSVAYRYEGNEDPWLPGESYMPCVHEPIKSAWLLDPVQVLKSCNCLSYQSCEHDGWRASLACAFLNSLKGAAIAKLPGYDQAEWGAPEPSAVPAIA